MGIKCTIVSPFGLGGAFVPGGTHYLEGNVRFEPLADEHKIRIIEYLDEIGRDDLSQKVRKKPVYIIPHAEKSTRDKPSVNLSLDDYLYIHRFAIEIFVDKPIPMASFDFDGQKVISHSFDWIDLSNQEIEYQITSDDWDNHRAFLIFLYKAIYSAPAAPLAIKRLCKALKSGPTQEGLIELAISLECLVGAQTEIKYQFALNHALAHTSDLLKRDDIFGLLQSLYDVRSRTVHGGSFSRADNAKMKLVSQRWSDLINVCQNNITYYILFCSDRGHDFWNEHLRMLALGAERISSEGAE